MAAGVWYAIGFETHVSHDALAQAEGGLLRTWAHGHHSFLKLGQESRKNSEIHIDVSHSRQPLVKGERLVRYEVNTVMTRGVAQVQGRSAGGAMYTSRGCGGNVAHIEHNMDMDIHAKAHSC